MANCQAGMFAGLCQPVGTGIGGQGAVSARELDLGRSTGLRRRKGVPEDRQGYRSKTELAFRRWCCGHMERGHREGWMGRGGRRLRDVAVLPGRALAALGMWYVLDVPSGFTVWPPEPARTSAAYQGFGRPRKPRLRDGQRRTMVQRSDQLPEEAWREITVALPGASGSYLFSAQRVRPTSRRKPGDNPLGRLPPEPGRQRIPAWQLATCPMPPEDTAVGDPGIRGRLPVGYRNGV